jgi:conjugative relaxase-like TrwC/TraI family protein
VISYGEISSVGYYSKIEAEDYYTRGNMDQGSYLGEGARILGLVGPVYPGTLERLFEGLSPDGKQALVMNAASPARRSGWDLTVSVPKSYSVLWSQASPAIRAVLENINQRAVEETINYLEENAAFVRTGKGGAELHRAGLVVAVFNHFSSRNLDPNVHSHMLVVNLGVTEGKTNSLFSPMLYAHKMDAGAIYRASLAAHLERELGVEIERKNDLFDIKDVPHELMKSFSSRRETIEKTLQEKGWNSAKAAAIITLTTRPPKREPEQDTLLAHWQSVGRSYGFSTAEVDQLIGTFSNVRSSEKAREEILYAVKARLERSSGFTARVLTRLIAVEAPGRGLDRKDIQGLAREFLVSNEVIPLSHKGDQMYSLAQRERTISQELTPDLEPEWEITE